MHSTALHGAAQANLLHGAARTGKSLRLHIAAWTAKQRQLHGAARTCGSTGPHIYPTANCPSILQPILSNHNPIDRSESARPTVHELHGIAPIGGPNCCTEMHRMYGVNQCTDPMQQYCKFHTSARHCKAPPCSMHVGCQQQNKTCASRPAFN